MKYLFTIFLIYTLITLNAQDPITQIESFVEVHPPDDTTSVYLGKSSGQKVSSDFPQLNTFVGGRAGRDNTSGIANSFFGSVAGISNITGENNSFFGASAGAANEVGSFNSFFGSFAGGYNITGRYNSFFGYFSGNNNEEGSFNSFFGYGAGSTITTQSQMIIIGPNAGPSNPTVNDSKQLFIDVAERDDPLIFGDFQKRLLTVHQSQEGVSGEQGLRIRRGTLNEYWTMHLQQDGDLAFYNSQNNAQMSLSQNGDLRISGTLNPPSDANMKSNFQTIDHEEILSKVTELPITKWNYKNSSEKHIGPMAQDFYAAFGLGQGETTIATVDADGVALAAIQALADKSDRLEKENKTLHQKNQELERRIARIEKLVVSQK